MKQIKSVTLVVALLSLTASFSSARPAATARANTPNRRGDQPPRLSDTLTVAKSPFEPITLAPSQPGARNGERGPPVADVPAKEIEVAASDVRTTRSAQSFEEQQSSASTKGLDETSGIALEPQASGSTLSVVTTETPREPMTTTESEPAETATETDTTKLSGESDSITTTTTAAPSSSEAPNTKIEATTTTQEPPATMTTTEEPTTTTSTTTRQPETTTSTTTTTTTTAAPEATTLVDEPDQMTTTTTTTTTSTTESSTTAAAVPAKDEENLKEASVEPVASTTTTTTEAPAPPKLAEEQPSNQPESGEPLTTETPADIQRERPLTTTTQAPTSSSTTEAPAPVPSSTSAPTVESSTATTTTTTTTSKPTDSGEIQKKEDSCNHLPTYNSDEIQRVFREETTYRNRTIKGKFTYINFDQRYRLVHYTRLPYGPVKIDRVEELGRPKQEGSGSDANEPSPASPNLNEIPNAVLQLRNMLPNSLFGFPFLGPNSLNQPNLAMSPRAGSEDDKNSMYFYSTDSISTPNLLTPRVPVSLLPGQRMRAQLDGAPAADILRQSYQEASAPNASDKPDRLAFGMPNGQSDYSKQLNKLDEPVARSDSSPWSSSPSRFQYANSFSSQQAPHEPAKNFVYPYLSGSTHTQPAHYQYAPLPPVYQPLQYRPMFQSMNDPAVVASSSHHQHIHHHHQPHGHEHYVAPFMLQSQQADQPSDSSDPARLRLKVKSSKALNVNQEGVKSAQLRSHSSNGHYSLESPVRQHQRNQHHRQRSGKQNQQLIKSAPVTKHSPVVYHVLRNPSGQVYSNFNQGYAVAFDHDN